MIGEGGDVLALASRPANPLVRFLPAMAAVLTLVGISGVAFPAEVFTERRPLCLECHGKDGISRNPEVPSLGGLPEFYALLQLVEFRDGERESVIMNTMVKGMTDDDLRAAAAFVGKQPRPASLAQPGDPARIARGRELAEKHRCGFCHGPEFLGGHQMPPLRNQREDYLLKALRDYKAQKRIGLRAAMAEVLQPLNDPDFVDLSHYLAHLASVR
jgi:cytochrome c553